MTRDPDRLEPSADPIVDLILYLVADRAPGKSIGPDAVARAFAAEGAKAGDPPNAWRRYGRPVRRREDVRGRQPRTGEAGACKNKAETRMNGGRSALQSIFGEKRVTEKALAL